MKKTLYTEQNRVFLAMLRELRLRAKVPQTVLAKALGVSQSDVSKVERGVRRLDVIELAQWLRPLDVSLIDFAAQLTDHLEAIAARTQTGRRHPASRP